MPFGVANALALVQGVLNKILYILRRRPLVQELISRRAEMEANIHDVSLGTNTREDDVLLLREFFIVWKENFLRIKFEKCEFMKEEMEYLDFKEGYGWLKTAASKMQPLEDMQIPGDREKGLRDMNESPGRLQLLSAIHPQFHLLPCPSPSPNQENCPLGVDS